LERLGIVFNEEYTLYNLWLVICIFTPHKSNNTKLFKLQTHKSQAISHERFSRGGLMIARYPLIPEEMNILIS